MRFLLTSAGENRKNGLEDIVHEMPEPLMKTFIVLDSQILDEHDVMELLFELEAFQYLPADLTTLDKAVQRFREIGRVMVPVAKITADSPIGPTLHLSPEPQDVEVTIPSQWVRYVLQYPEGEGKVKFPLGFYDRGA